MHPFHQKQNDEIKQAHDDTLGKCKAFRRATEADPTSLESRKQLEELCEAANALFRIVESAVIDSGPLENTDLAAWNEERLQDSINVLSGIPDLFDTIRDRRARLGLPASMFEPSPARFTNMQRRVLADAPAEAERLKSLYEKQALPTLGFTPPVVKGQRDVVIVLHGIRTRGSWQKDISPVLTEAEFTPEPLDYGFFAAIQLLFPPSRQAKIEWFKSEFEKIKLKYPGRALHVVAHSFGTYIIARSLEKYPNHIHFNRLIFCGSIVNEHFDWPTAVNQELVTHVLNDYGGLDFWAKIVKYFVSDAGDSGRFGFQNVCPEITQHFHREWRHSDYFFSSNFKDRWCPFLKGITLDNLELGGNHRHPIGLYLLLLIAVIVVIGLLLFLKWRYT